MCAFGQIICDGNEAKTCDGKGGFMADQTKKCGTKCSDGLGCVQCMPNTGTCASKVAKVCDPTGTQEVNIACDGLGMECQADGCKGACSPTTLGLSYRGCEFWPTVTSNSVWSDCLHQGDGGFHFGVLLGNDSTKVTAHVTITREGSKPIDLALPPGKVVQQALDWVPELKGPDWEMPFLPTGPTQSVKKAGGAYHIVSDSPIIAYQFNALEGRAGNANGCPLLPNGGGGCYSYSNDASLLIPAHALSSSYVVSGYHAWHSDHFPQNGTGKLNMGDFIAITATAETMVTVALRPNQTVLPSLGADPLPHFSAGGKMSFAMTSGMVVQLFTPGLSENETFGGTEVTASAANGGAAAPIQIISGMGCASIPEDVSPCGHVEDLVLPSEVLGKDYVVPAMVASTNANVPIAQTIRIQSISDGTALTFEPTKFNAVTLESRRGARAPERRGRCSNHVHHAVCRYAVHEWAGRHCQGVGDGREKHGRPEPSFGTSHQPIQDRLRFHRVARLRYQFRFHRGADRHRRDGGLSGHFTGEVQRGRCDRHVGDPLPAEQQRSGPRPARRQAGGHLRLRVQPLLELHVLGRLRLEAQQRGGQVRGIGPPSSCSEPPSQSATMGADARPVAAPAPRASDHASARSQPPSSGARPASARARSSATPRMAMELPCVVLLGTQIAPEDLIGVPRIREIGPERFATEFCPPSAILRTTPFLLFVDELNSAVPDVQKAFYSLILDRRLGDYELPEGSRVVAAGNRVEDRALVRPMATALANRMVHVALEPSADAWLALGERSRRAPAGAGVHSSAARSPLRAASQRRDARVPHAARVAHALRCASPPPARRSGPRSPRGRSAIERAPSSPRFRQRALEAPSLEAVAAGTGRGAARSRAHLFPRRELPGAPLLERSGRRRARRQGGDRARRGLERGRGVGGRRGAVAGSRRRRPRRRSKARCERAARRHWSMSFGSAAMPEKVDLHNDPAAAASGALDKIAAARVWLLKEKPFFGGARARSLGRAARRYARFSPVR